MIGNIASSVFITLGLIIIGIAIFGMYRYTNFYKRILIVSLIDTVGLSMIIIGIIIRNGLHTSSIKLIILLGISVFLNPIATHMIVRGAHLSGFVNKENDKC